MNKDLKAVIQKTLKRDHLRLNHYNSVLSDLYDLLDEARCNADCGGCENEEKYSKMIFDDRYTQCMPDKACDLVVKTAVKIKHVVRKEQDCRDKYGRKAYEILKEYNPVILSIRDDSEMPWSRVFNTEKYQDLSEEQKTSLIALIELDGGVFRVKEVDYFFDE